MGAMANKFLVIVLTALFFSVTGAGLAEKIKEGEVVYYRIIKGDTLWDISERFFEDPFRWQKLWKRNPYVKNPDLIYPGDVLKITPGEIEVVKRKIEMVKLPLVKLPPPPQPVEEEVLPPPQPVKEEPPAPPPVKKVVSHLMQRDGFITKEELKESGVIVGPKEKMILLHHGDEVFLSFMDPGALDVGDRFTIFTVVGEIRHPVTKKPMGNLVDNLGSLHLTDVHDDAIEGRIDVSYKEIMAGAKLRQYEEPVKEVEVVEAKGEVGGIIVAALENVEMLFDGDVVFIDKGAQDGLQEGNILEVYRERAPLKDPLSKKTLSFRPEELGTLILIGVKEEVSTAIILHSLRPIKSGDHVRTPGFVE
jgi:hypothetical protein